MNKTVFYGDSITNRFVLLKQNKNVVNLGVGGDKTTELIGRVLDVIREKPNKLFIMVGVNDYLVKKAYWQEFFNINFEVTYNALITLLTDNLRNTSFTLLSILPVSMNKPFDTLVLYNKELDEINKYISEIASKYNLNYLDISNSFKDKNNFLNPQYTEDGVHLNNLGYKVYYNLIKDLI